MPQNPTSATYDNLNAFYAAFNDRLFAGILPGCLITIQRHQGCYGYFRGSSWTRKTQSDDTIDEIALNSVYFERRDTDEILATLVHEMVHLWQHHFGHPGRRGYHNREWAKKMREVGLIPSTTGQIGGKATGERVSHYIEEEGAFARVCAELCAEGLEIPYVQRAFPKGSRRKTTYTCPICGLNAWAQPGVLLLCGNCRQTMVVRKR